MENLLIEYRETVAVVTVNRPRSMNSLTTATLHELDSLLDDIVARKDIRAIVLTGAGEKSFVAGADITEIRNLDMQSGKEFAARGSALFSKIEKLRIPVIAAINGYALGSGCELAMACHLRIASENAKFAQPEINLGLLPGYGGTQRLPRLIGRARALDLLLTGRMISAEEALQWGLVNAVVPQAELMTITLKLAADLAGKPKKAVETILETVDIGLQLGLDSGLHVEENLFAFCCGTHDKNEGATAFLEKRSPEFKGH